jgi:hypothetical protein
MIKKGAKTSLSTNDLSQNYHFPFLFLAINGSSIVSFPHMTPEGTFKGHKLDGNHFNFVAFFPPLHPLKNFLPFFIATKSPFSFKFIGQFVDWYLPKKLLE